MSGRCSAERVGEAERAAQADPVQLKIMQDIIRAAIAAAQPACAVREALEQFTPPKGRLILIAIGKAAVAMAAAVPITVDAGIVITKDGHGAELPAPLLLREAGHPVPDERSYAATAEAMELVRDLDADDLVLFLVSGGGSALFEYPLIPAAELERLTEDLLRSGADIVEMNTLRKRFSAVKGGRFAERCAPARVFQIVLSDVIGDPLDMIASGPAHPDTTRYEDAVSIVKRYRLELSATARTVLRRPLPSILPNVRSLITGSVMQLCNAAAEVSRAAGYEAVIVSSTVRDEARLFGAALGRKAKDERLASDKAGPQPARAYIYGGETVVRVRGKGKGGRNQEIVLAASQELAGTPDVLLFSFGSDGTDGPTDAAGAWCDGSTRRRFLSDPEEALAENNSYPCLKAVDQLIMTGPTGTNVNDLTVLLLGVPSVRSVPTSDE